MKIIKIYFIVYDGVCVIHGFREILGVIIDFEAQWWADFGKVPHRAFIRKIYS
mgnify:FL=1